MASILVASVHDTNARDEVAVHIVGSELDTPVVVSDSVEDSFGDTLSRLAIAVAREHTVDIRIVHRPEAFHDVEGEGVGGRDDKDPVFR